MCCSGKKREAYMIEMQKLREGRHSTPQHSVVAASVQGRLTISDIKLPLKSQFMSEIGAAHGKLVLLLMSLYNVIFKNFEF